MDSIIIIIPTHSAYIDICENFLALLQKNWVECPYKVIISLTGKKIELENYEVMYNGETATLPECIYNAAKRYSAKFYMCFLGDAFINKKINFLEIKDLYSFMIQNHINYCSLTPVIPHKKVNNVNEKFRYINIKDRYSHNFIAFMASLKFIEDEFKDKLTDLDFEIKYLNLANNTNKSYYFTDRIIATRNIFEILPGIKKGKWDRMILKKLEKKNPEIRFSEREKMSYRKILINRCSYYLQPIFPNILRIILKKMIKKYLKVNFTTEI